MKNKLKYTASPWFFLENTVKSMKTHNVIAEVKGDKKDERTDNCLIISSAPEMLGALLAEEAYCCMPCDEGSPILESLGYREGSKMDFVRKLRKEALKKAGIL